MAQKEISPKVVLPRDLRELTGSADPEDVVWLAEWILRRAARGSAGKPSGFSTESAFLRVLVELLSDYEARFPAEVESSSKLTAEDSRLVELRAHLATLFAEERKSAPRLSAAERTFRRLTLFRSVAGGFDEDHAALVRDFRVETSPDKAAARLIQLVFSRSTRTQDEAKARLRSNVRAPQGETDDEAVLSFVLRRVLWRGPEVVSAVVEAWRSSTGRRPKAEP